MIGIKDAPVIAESKRLDADGVPLLLRRLRHEPGQPAVLLLHGGNSSGDAFLAPRGGLAGFLRKRGFGKAETAKIIGTVLAEEGRKPESVFDFVQGITAVARDKPHQDARLDLEGRAKKLLDRAA